MNGTDSGSGEEMQKPCTKVCGTYYNLERAVANAMRQGVGMACGASTVSTGLEQKRRNNDLELRCDCKEKLHGEFNKSHEQKQQVSDLWW